MGLTNGFSVGLDNGNLSVGSVPATVLFEREKARANEQNVKAEQNKTIRKLVGIYWDAMVSGDFQIVGRSAMLLEICYGIPADKIPMPNDVTLTVYDYDLGGE